MSKQPKVVVTLLDGTTKHFNHLYEYSKIYESLTLHSHNDQPSYVAYRRNGTVQYQIWHNNGNCHRDNDKPAAVFYDLKDMIYIEEWRKNGKLHRGNGLPARIIYYPNNTVDYQAWYMEGRKITEQEAKRRSKLVYEVMPNYCPFCNSDDIFILYAEDYVNVVCNSCKAEGPRKDLTDVEEAIEAWNLRRPYL